MAHVDCLIPIGPGEQAWAGIAVESMLNQVQVKTRAICVLDQREDPPRSMTHLLDDERVVLARNSRKPGIAGALNTGITMATSQWIARLDSDDMSVSTRLQSQLSCANSNTVLVFASAAGISTSGSQSSPRHIDRHGFYQLSIARLLLSNPIPHSTALLRRSALESLNGYNEDATLLEDYDLWLRLSTKGELIGRRESLVLRREHAGQLSRRRRSLSDYSRLHAPRRMASRHTFGTPLIGSAAHAFYLGEVGTRSVLLRLANFR